MRGILVSNKNPTIEEEILAKAKELQFLQKDFGDTYQGSQRQLIQLVKYFLYRYADDGK